MSKRSTVALSLLTVILCSTASPVDAGGMPAAMQVGPANLVLNGSGVRTKGPFQLYLAGLYLVEKGSEPDGIIAADDPMAIRIEIVSRLVSQSRMLASLNEGFQKSTGGQVESLEEQINAFREFFSEKISRGDIFEITYEPRMGTVVNKNGKKKGVIQGVDFKKALFGIWLCDQPADADLKRELLASQGQSKTSLVGTATPDTR